LDLVCSLKKDIELQSNCNCSDPAPKLALFPKLLVIYQILTVKQQYPVEFDLWNIEYDLIAIILLMK